MDGLSYLIGLCSGIQTGAERRLTLKCSPSEHLVLGCCSQHCLNHFCTSHCSSRHDTSEHAVGSWGESAVLFLAGPLGGVQECPCNCALLSPPPPLSLGLPPASLLSSFPFFLPLPLPAPSLFFPSFALFLFFV